MVSKQGMSCHVMDGIHLWSTTSPSFAALLIAKSSLVRLRGGVGVRVRVRERVRQ